MSDVKYPPRFKRPYRYEWPLLVRDELSERNPIEYLSLMEHTALLEAERARYDRYRRALEFYAFSDRTVCEFLNPATGEISDAGNGIAKEALKEPERG